MLKMLNSASRLVLIIMAATVCAAFLLRIMDSKDFMILTSGVFAFYFTKTNGSEDKTPEQ